MLDALASHYGEPVLELLRRWPWKLFCARWRRLVDYMAAEQRKKREREREDAFRKLQDETRREHSERARSGMTTGY